MPCWNTTVHTGLTSGTVKMSKGGDFEMMIESRKKNEGDT